DDAAGAGRNIQGIPGQFRGLAQEGGNQRLHHPPSKRQIPGLTHSRPSSARATTVASTPTAKANSRSRGGSTPRGLGTVGPSLTPPAACRLSGLLTGRPGEEAGGAGLRSFACEERPEERVAHGGVAPEVDERVPARARPHPHPRRPGPFAPQAP